MLEVKGYEDCRRAGRSLRNLQSEYNAKRREIIGQEQTIQEMNGKLQIAMNTLSRLERGAAAVASGSVAVALDIVSRDIPSTIRDGVQLAIVIQSEIAGQNRRIDNINSEIRRADQSLKTLNL